MGVAMAHSWRDYLAAAQAAEPHDDRDDTDDRGANVPNVPNVIHDAIAAGVMRIQAMPPPRNADRRAWQGAVGDSVALVNDGWAAAALGLGWSPLDLFGGQVAKSGDPHADGLAVWLQGRRVVALTADHAVAIDANGGRHFFNRPRSPGAVMLWSLGRGR